MYQTILRNRTFRKWRSIKLVRLLFLEIKSEFNIWDSFNLTLVTIIMHNLKNYAVVPYIMKWLRRYFYVSRTITLWNSLVFNRVFTSLSDFSPIYLTSHSITLSKVALLRLLISCCYASKWRRYYRRSTGHCSVLPLGTATVVLAIARYYRSVLPPWSGTTAFGAGISRVLPPRVYRPLSALT